MTHKESAKEKIHLVCGAKLLKKFQSKQLAIGTAAKMDEKPKCDPKAAKDVIKAVMETVNGPKKHLIPSNNSGLLYIASYAAFTPVHLLYSAHFILLN